MLTFFAKDGSFGDADGLVTIDTRMWSSSDWERVEDALDYRRAVRLECVRITRAVGTLTV